MRRIFTILALGVLLGLLPNSANAQEKKKQLWLYYPTNLGVDANVDKAEQIWTRAAAAGYTHVLLGDSKFARLDQMYKDYFKNCDRTKQIAKKLNLQIVPAVFSIGYSNDILSQDPNLAEGLPVKDELFVVKDGEARPAPEQPVAFKKLSFHDPSVTIADGVATLAPGKGPARLIYNVAVMPFHCYHISVMVKTQDFKARPEIKATAGDVEMQWQYLGTKPTQDWTRHDVVFNSLNNQAVNVYLGVWDDIKGSLQWKDWKIEEVGLLNVLRRPGAPCTVKGDGDGKVYKEGTDFQPIVDPHMGNDPYAGEYKSYHTPPTIHTKLPDGTRLRVSWYHPAIIYDEQVTICISEPKTTALLADQARRMKKLWGAPLYMMEHDEFRTCNWDEACQKRGETPGKMLAENLRQCTNLLKPQHAAVWNDMFDPYHNAVKGPYYLVNGPLTGSWEGLDKDVLVVNWNYEKRDESLKFFADRGNPQLIAGYYDGPLSDFTNWMTSAKKVKGVIGYMYTTWRGDYSAIETFARMSRQ
ncbi:MAG TPA: hypothetical protein VFC78_18425 [Tepidisphaeraceae bacterium]|nr:hypothetical protein [Tepidisphaeraceae bacterium]